MNFVLDRKLVNVISETVNSLAQVDADELTGVVNLGVSACSVTVLYIHVPELGLKVSNLLVSLGLRNEVKVSGYHDHRRLGGSAFNILQPWLQASQPYFTIHDVPEKKVE